MATQTVLFTGTAGMTPVTVDVLDADAGTSFATAVAATETTGQYSFSLTDSAGTYRVNIKLSGSQIGVLFVKTLNTASTFYCMAERWMTTSPTAVDVRQEVDSNSTQLAAIVADTNELQTNQGNWLTADVSDIPTNAEFAARTLVAADYFDASTDVVTLHSDYDAAKTAASQASVTAIDDFVDTEVTAIKAVTDKVDTMVVLDGAVYQYTVNAVELAPGGGTTNVSVYPLNASMPLKTKGSVLTFYKNEAGEVIGPITVTTRDGSVITPVDLSGMTLEVRFVDYEGTEVLTVLNADITVSGADSNQFDFVVTTALTGTVTEEHEDQWHYWSLRDVTGGDDNVLVAGRARVLIA